MPSALRTAVVSLVSIVVLYGHVPVTYANTAPTRTILIKNDVEEHALKIHPQRPILLSFTARLSYGIPDPAAKFEVEKLPGDRLMVTVPRHVRPDGYLGSLLVLTNRHLTYYEIHGTGAASEVDTAIVVDQHDQVELTRAAIDALATLRTQAAVDNAEERHQAEIATQRAEYEDKLNELIKRVKELRAKVKLAKKRRAQRVLLDQTHKDIKLYTIPLEKEQKDGIELREAQILKIGDYYVLRLAMRSTRTHVFPVERLELIDAAGDNLAQFV
ncbi:MAG: hypothetical protein AAGC55_23305, partial [Myxococcota bacterium]